LAGQALLFRRRRAKFLADALEYVWCDERRRRGGRHLTNVRRSNSTISLFWRKGRAYRRRCVREIVAGGTRVYPGATPRQLERLAGVFIMVWNFLVYFFVSWLLRRH
jgi:hypothetical protein